MQTKMIDLGWAMARLGVTDVDNGDGTKKQTPTLVICWPGSEEQPSGAIELWDFEGLHNLRTELAAFLDEWDQLGVDHGSQKGRDAVE